MGHIAPVCRSKPLWRLPKSTRKTKWLATSESGQSLAQPDPVPLFAIQDRYSSPYLVELKVNGQPLTMEVDTGAAVSLAQESALASLLPSAVIQASRCGHLTDFPPVQSHNSQPIMAHQARTRALDNRKLQFRWHCSS